MLDTANSQSLNTPNAPSLSQWSKVKPGLQLAWDATSLRALMQCDVKYDYSMRQGWRSESVHTDFGGLFASAQEVGWKVRCKGGSVADAQRASVKWVLENSGSYETTQAPYSDLAADPIRSWRPWGGRYATLWKCAGEAKYKNERGNHAKCPNAWVSFWGEGSDPGHCGKCGSRTISSRKWLPNDPAKNRNTLIRSVVWYWETMSDDPNVGLQPVSLPDGRPAVELSFCIPSGYKASTGEDFLLCGHMDKVARLGIEHFVTDNKTTGKYLGQDYFSGFSPDVQVDLYDLVGSMMFPDLNIKGVLIEGMQVQVAGAEFSNWPCHRTEEQRKEFYAQLGYWFAKAEAMASGAPLVHNRGTCWLCGFRGICAKPPATRTLYLPAHFKKSHWNPLDAR